MKLPSFQFYPGDWLKDPNLRRCSLAARGVWMDMMCLMWECEERGVLATAGRAWSDDDIAQAVGGDRTSLLSCIKELIDKGVASRTNSGAVYCRRVVRDECSRKAGAKRQSASRERLKSHAFVTALSEDEDEGEEALREREGGVGGGGGEKPLPAGLPKSEAQAVEWAGMQAVPGGFAIEVYHQLVGRGWVDGAGQSVENWRSHVHSRWMKLARTKAEDAQRPRSPMDLRSIITAKEKRRADLKNKYCAEGPLSSNWSDQKARAEFITIGREIKELNNQLSQMR